MMFGCTHSHTHAHARTSTAVDISLQTLMSYEWSSPPGGRNNGRGRHNMVERRADDITSVWRCWRLRGVLAILVHT